MARLTSQMKGTLTLMCSLTVSVACSFASRRFDQPAGKWALPAFTAASFFLLQAVLALAKSKEDIELAEFKRIQSAENENRAVEMENRTKTSVAIAERIIEEIRSGNLEQAERWNDFQKDHHGK